MCKKIVYFANIRLGPTEQSKRHIISAEKRKKTFDNTKILYAFSQTASFNITSIFPKQHAHSQHTTGIEENRTNFCAKIEPPNGCCADLLL